MAVEVRKCPYDSSVRERGFGTETRDAGKLQALGRTALGIPQLQQRPNKQQTAP